MCKTHFFPRYSIIEELSACHYFPDKHTSLFVNEALLYQCTEFTIASAKVYDLMIFLPKVILEILFKGKLNVEIKY